MLSKNITHHKLYKGTEMKFEVVTAFKGTFYCFCLLESELWRVTGHSCDCDLGKQTLTHVIFKHLIFIKACFIICY